MQSRSFKDVQLVKDDFRFYCTEISKLITCSKRKVRLVTTVLIRFQEFTAPSANGDSELGLWEFCSRRKVNKFETNFSFVGVLTDWGKHLRKRFYSIKQNPLEV